MADQTMRAFDNIKSFNGTSQDNSQDWCDRAEIVFTVFNINDADRLTRIGIKLDNAAFDWYRENPGPYIAWANFRTAFERAFPPPDRTQNRHLLAEQINQRKQGEDESVHDYYYALDKLCREYDSKMSPIDKTIKLVGGLTEELKEKMLPLNVQTPEQFMIQAKNFESSGKVMMHHRKQVASNELPEPSYTYEPNNYSAVAASRPQHQQFAQQHYAQIPGQPRQQQQFGQYQQRHLVSTHRRIQPLTNQHLTTTRMSSQQQGEHPSRHYEHSNINNYYNNNYHKCFKCGQQGHTQRYCPHHLNE